VGNGKNPSHKWRSRLFVFVNSFLGFDENLLGDILSIILIRYPIINMSVNPVYIIIIESSKGCPITLNCPLD
jgi:hypothetical protein